MAVHIFGEGSDMVLLERWIGDPDLDGVGDSVQQALGQIRIRALVSNERVEIHHLPDALRLVGSGTDAVAVQHPSLPEHVFKVFAPESLPCLADEFSSYQRLVGSPYFPVCVGHGPSYIMLSHEPGPTLYECLVEGICIDEQVIEDVESARAYARGVGLHPKDLHLKNVIVQGRRAKVLDVSKYVLPMEDDRVWEHLAEGYRRYYPWIRGRRVPVRLLDFAKRAYQAQDPDHFVLDEFAGRMHCLVRRLRPAGERPAATGPALRGG